MVGARSHTAVLRGPTRGPQGVVLIGISVWPPVDRDGDDIARWIEACWRQHATEFVADVLLERGKGRGQEFLTAAGGVAHAPGGQACRACVPAATAQGLRASGHTGGCRC